MLRLLFEFLVWGHSTGSLIVSPAPVKDTIRGFSDEQRLAIFWRDGGKCQPCGKECDENNFHADHIVPHAKGGKTK